MTITFIDKYDYQDKSQITLRHCPICKDEIPATAHRLKKLCGKKECMMEQQRISGRKSYNKVNGHSTPEPRRCVVCSSDISDLRGNRVVCLKPECKEVIVKRTKGEWYERNAGTAAYRAKIATNQANYRAARKPAPKPVEPKIDTRYQRKPKVSMKPTIRRKPVVKPRRIIDDNIDGNESWTPRVFNIPTSIASYSIGLSAKKPVSSFDNLWNCAACQSLEALCKLHQSMTDDGSVPPKISQY